MSDVPMIRELGGGRVQLDTAEELRRLGHHVETFDWRDAFRTGAPRIPKLRPIPFAAKARAFVRSRSGEFDVIDALQACLPYSKRDLGFSGLLVTRSTGLAPLYEIYTEYERKRWPERMPGTQLGQRLHRWRSHRKVAASLRGYEESDVVRVINDNERTYLEDVLGLGQKTVQISEGLPDAQIEALRMARTEPAVRLRRQEIVVIGSWCLRKGAADWPQIVKALRRDVPDARFLFVGTGVEEREVTRLLGVSEGVRVIPHYRSEELPALLSGASVSALPTYVEGYGLAIVEALAAGIPTVAYDVPGPRDILGLIPSNLVECGDAHAFASCLARVLGRDTSTYAELVHAGDRLVDRHRLSVIIPRLVRAYEEHLETVEGSEVRRSASPT